MKKAASIFLFCIFLFNTVGYFIAFKAEQFEIKNEIKSQIKSGLVIDELISITIDKKDVGNIEWEEYGKEMLYKNEMFDIVKSTETAQAITFYCIDDKKEKALFVNLDEHINTHIANAPIKKSASKKLADQVIKIYFSNEESIEFNIQGIPQSAFFLTPTNYAPSFIEINSPPPQFV